MNTTKDKPLFIRDRIARKIFADPNIGLKYAARIVAKVLELPEDDVIKNLKYLHPNIGKNAGSVDAEADLMFTDDKVIIDFEINLNNGPIIQRKNQHYQFELLARQIKTSKDYLNLQPVIQINFDYFDYFKEGISVYTTKFMETTLHLLENNDIVKYRINLLKLSQKDYTLIEKDSLDYLLYFFVCGDEKKLNKIYKGDKDMKEVTKLGKEIARERNNGLHITEEELYQIYREDYAISQYEEGIKQEKYNIIKKLLLKDISDETIIEVTGITKKELEKIKNNIKISKRKK